MKLTMLRRHILETLKKIDKRFNDPDIHQQLLDEATVLVENPNLINSDEYQAIKTWPEFEKKLDLKENLNIEENIRLHKEITNTNKEIMNMNKEEQKQIELKKQQEIEENMKKQLKEKEENMKKQLEKDKRFKDIEKVAQAARSRIESMEKKQIEEENAKKQKEALELLKKTDKDLVFDIVRIDFSAFSDTQDITENIVRAKMIDNEINNKKADNEKLKTIFVTFMKKYNEYLSIYVNNIEMDEKQKKDLNIFIYTYLLLACCNTALIESKKPLTKFNNESWWFFTADDFKVISKFLDIETIINSFNRIIGVEPEVTPENKDIKEIENVAQDVAQGVTQAEVKTDVKNIEGDKPSDESK